MRQLPESRWAIAALLLILAGAVGTAMWVWQKKPSTTSTQDSSIIGVARQVAEIEAAEVRAAQKFFPKELKAEECARTIEQLWDDLNAASNKLAVLQAFKAGEIHGPLFGPVHKLPQDILVSAQSGAGTVWTPATWPTFIAATSAAGWDLVRCEFRNSAFDTDRRGQPARSRFYCSAHLTNRLQPERAILEGYVDVTWKPGSTGTPAAIARVDAADFSLRQRAGDPPFREVLNRVVTPPPGSFFIDPLLLYDLDGDGRSEIILAAKNLVLQRTASGEFVERPLCQFSPGLIFTGVLADFDGDGAVDFLCAKFEGLYLFRGSAQGTFDEPGRLVWSATPHLKYAQALTCADIDGDGDLDVWLGQYKSPYDRGQMPTPYYDANDGYASFLLLNDGHGNFTDATASSGLALKRWRRAYSASFVDLDQDGHPDLVVASDFAGLDLYHNDGHGHFQNRTKAWLPEPHGFGMSQLSADLDGDGKLDLLMIGMNVPVMDRLQHSGQARAGFESYLTRGSEMAHGNRLFLGQPPYRSTPLEKAMARTGWSWGASAADFDNDGFLDLYITNGHETKATVHDYETEFWLHDIYVGTSTDDLPAFAYFQTKYARTRGHGWSYGGNERSRLFLNQQGQSFVEAAHLMGAAVGQDSRNVVADDLDGDGKLDLLVTTFEAWPRIQQTLRIYENHINTTNNWIGFRLREQGNGISPVNAMVTVRNGDRIAVHQVVTGDSYRSQQAATAHFGLGSASQVDTVEIRWRNGRSVSLRKPAINQYHTVLLPKE